MDPTKLKVLKDLTPLVRKIVGGFQRKLPLSVCREDLLAAGMAGLWDAIRRQTGPFDDGFEWYAQVRIRGAILDEMRAQDWLPRYARGKGSSKRIAPSIVRSEDLDCGGIDNLTCLEDDTTEVLLQKKNDLALVLTQMSNLSTRDQLILRRHYFEGAKFKEIAAELDVSEPRISQLHARALQALQLLVKRHSLTAPHWRA